MKIIFLSDIHSNWHYLEQVNKSIKEEKADLIYFIGDVIGYYDEPNKVLDWLREVGAVCIKGNHEKYFLDELSYDNEFISIYQSEVNKTVISLENKNLIKSWQDKVEITINNKIFLILHGDINSSENHVYDVDKIDKSLLKEYDYYIFGHTHIPLIHYSYGCCIINPGAIGQPRDYTGLSSYAVVNLNTKEVSIKKINIEKKSYIVNLEKKLFNKKVIDILKRDKNEKN